MVTQRNPLFSVMALGDVEVVVKDGVVHKGGPGRRAGGTPQSGRANPGGAFRR
jgi:hypothetical protein